MLMSFCSAHGRRRLASGGIAAVWGNPGAQRAENGHLTDALDATSLLSRITRVYKNEMYPDAGNHSPEVEQAIHKCPTAKSLISTSHVYSY
jgi:hypothetical protein